MARTLLSIPEKLNVLSEAEVALLVQLVSQVNALTLETYQKDPKDSVRAALTSNVALTGLQTLDDVALVDGNRFAALGQTIQKDRGIYIVHDTAWERAEDFAVGDTVAGAYFNVEEGTLWKEKFFICTNDAGADVVGTDNLTFALTYAATDHGSLLGLADDDHTQYHNDTRGDIRYFPQTSFIAASAGVADAGKPIVLDAAGVLDVTFFDLTDWDSRFFTEAEHVATSAGAGDAAKPIVLDVAGVLDVTFFDLSDWDSRFFTETEHISTSAGAGDAAKPIVLDVAGVLDVTFFDLSDWDSRFFTEAEHVATSAGAGDAAKPIVLDVAGVLDVTFFDLTDWDSRFFTEAEHINTSAGGADAAKPIVLDASGFIDSTMIPTAILGLASGYKGARGVATIPNGTNTVAVVTGLATVVSCTVSLTAPAGAPPPIAEVTQVTCDLTGAAGTVNVNGFKPAAAGDCTLIAGTPPGGGTDVHWIAIGT